MQTIIPCIWDGTSQLQ